MRALGSLVCVLFVLALQGCDECVPTQQGMATTADSKYVAMALLYDCGGETGRAFTMVVVRPMQDSAKAYDEGEVFTVEGSTISIEWTGPRSLTIRYPSSARVLGRRAPLKGITVDVLTE